MYSKSDERIGGYKKKTQIELKRNELEFVLVRIS